MKLVTLGCSLTHNYGLADELANLMNMELLNLAHVAGSNQLQINRFHEVILNKKIDKTDVIYWQVTGMARSYSRLQMDRFKEIDKIQKEQFTGFFHHYVCDSVNIFDKKNRIDLLSNSPINPIVLDVNQELQTLLSTIILASHFTHRIIVVFGWENVMSKYQMSIFKKQLLEHQINYIDESYLEYAIINGLEMMDDNHPAYVSGRIFSKKIIYPKLLSLGWV
jgi:hypothetical protein